MRQRQHVLSRESEAAGTVRPSRRTSSHDTVAAARLQTGDISAVTRAAFDKLTPEEQAIITQQADLLVARLKGKGFGPGQALELLAALGRWVGDEGKAAEVALVVTGNTDS